mmetsp:Transcript_94954/g.188070  ORF Transcript_94954/g.188070 Transcript_94954/m.188070 type:complete len:437 (+) Transcript_94954:66-1376(+)
MGAYLSQPVIDKESSTGRSTTHAWGCSSMQGWRKHMEDSHITISNLGGKFAGIACFGVFDGHGGREVAQFCRHYLPDEIRRQLLSIGEKESALGSSALFGKALKQGFHAMDDMLRSPEHERMILAFKQGGAADLTGDSSSSSSKASPSTADMLSTVDVDADETDSNASSGDEETAVGVEAQNQGSKGNHYSKPTVLSLLQTSISTDLAQARNRGSLKKEEAAQVMMKMALLRKLESQAPLDNADAGIVDNVGCTAVCILLTEQEVVCANAGDSRSILCRNGRPIELSHDHKPNHKTESDRIEAAGGRVETVSVGTRVQYRINGNLNVSRAIGDHEYKKRPELGHEKQMICSTPDIVTVPLTQEDEFVVLACDGVWDVKTNQEVCDFVRPRLMQGEDTSKIVEMLLDNCVAADPKENHGLGGDNMTCIIVQLQHRTD